MIEIICIFYIIFLIYIIDYIILRNLIYLILIILIFKFNWLNWSYIFFNFRINYYSIGLIIIIIWIFIIIIINLNIEEHKNFCIFINLLLLVSIYIIFFSINLLLFYFIFELRLLLIFYIIIKWGYGEFRFNSSFYLIFYTLIYSLPLLYLLYNLLNLFNRLNFYILEILNIFYINNFKFLYIIISFFVKIPIYIVHGWLLKAHVEASFFRSIILASIILKLGRYGILRIIYIIKFIFKKFYIYFIIINLFGILILRIICIYQIDIKLIVAISSVVHIGIILIRIILIIKLGIHGRYYIIISHGFISSKLFYFINLIYRKTNSRLIFINKGIINFLPSVILIWFIICFCNSGSPFSLNLIREILLLIRLILWFKYLFIFLIIYCLLSFIYSIYLFRFVQHGKIYINFKIYNININNYLRLIIHLIPVNLIFFNLI